MKQQRTDAYFGQDVTSAFPTEGRERQKIVEKARKAAVIKAPTRPKPVEEHFDDCGSDLSGVGPDIQLLASSYTLESTEPESSDDEISHQYGL